MSDYILSASPQPYDFKEFYGGDRSQFVEIRLPRGRKDTAPVVFFVHGGFWKTEFDLSHASHLCAALTNDLAVATVNIEYRRLGRSGGNWPVLFQDVGAAADCLPALSEKYHFDLSKAICSGHSAGGQLSLWLVSRAKIKSESSTLFSRKPMRFHAAVSLAGVADLRSAFHSGLGGGIVKDLIGAPEKYPERYSQVSPIESLPLQVQTVLIHGREDQIVPIAQSEKFVEKAVSLGDDATLVSLDGGHFELIDPLSRQWPMVKQKIAGLIKE